ncbi:MAG: hypothetical protein ACOYKE_02485 [Ferruginibacter sp.]
MDFKDLTTLGGGTGAVVAYLLNITLVNTIEMALYALVGSIIGEGVKLLINRFKKNNSDEG